MVEEEWAAAAGKEAKTTLRERKRGGRDDCSSPRERRSEGKSIVLEHLVELDGFPHIINNLREWMLLFVVIKQCLNTVTTHTRGRLYNHPKQKAFFLLHWS